MKGIRLLFTVCLAPLALYGAWADDGDDIARAATRRGTTTTLSTSRQKPITQQPTNPQSGTISRTTNVQKATVVRERTPGTTPTARDNAISDTGRGSSEQKSVSARTGARVQSRTATAKTVTVPIARSAVRTKPNNTNKTSGLTRAATTSRSATRTAPSLARTATSSDDIRTQVMSNNYAQCRTVFYDCMDEFCANKDSQLKRCACSVRASEFDGVKKQLAAAEEKLLDFSQRLLTVNMEKEDAQALFNATEGEEAFYGTDDRSESKKMLDEIAKKLNTSFDDSNFDQNLNAISLSLNTDAAFDTVDSLMGASTTAKSGTELYSAALPVCRKMALEICSSDELAMAESGYKMKIEQDCNTVAKSYSTQMDQTRAKILESSALLDMSRLDIHQKRNSDDILTCKSKMLNMLTDPTVCGDNMGLCLDTTGRYIDPTTGEAFLTVDLANLSTLITRPDADHTWTSAPGNQKFVTFLNSKKKFLEPAMENCQNISDYVWDAFIEDALAQIKLAQDKKLEDMRQSCTTLTAQCLSDATKSIQDFDARALSIFGVQADKTVKAMCSDIQTACTALLQQTGDTIGDWESGMAQIATDKTYETIMNTCREVGRACIVQTCTSISGNFGLCENIDTSINRKSIINRTACWDEVLACVASAGADSLGDIMTSLGKTPGQASGDFYPEIYAMSFDQNRNLIGEPRPYYNGESVGIPRLSTIYDNCSGCATNNYSYDCATCRLAEKIWGNCEHAPTYELTDADSHNRIIKPQNDETTLLYWFAYNTGTSNALDSCRDTSCGVGLRWDPISNTCLSNESYTTDGKFCSADVGTKVGINVTIDGNEITNCCIDSTMDDKGKCCSGFGGAGFTYETDDNNKICVAEGTQAYKIMNLDSGDELWCVGTGVTPDNTTDEFPAGDTVHCNGTYVLRDADGLYSIMSDTPTTTTVTNYYNTDDKDHICTSDQWNAGECPTPDNWRVRYGKVQ